MNMSSKHSLASSMPVPLQGFFFTWIKDLVHYPSPVSKSPDQGKVVCKCAPKEPRDPGTVLTPQLF